MISVIIPSKNEPYLQQTVRDILLHAKNPIQILIGLDGDGNEEEVIAWTKTLETNQLVEVVYSDTSVGQRETMNTLAHFAKYPWIMKCDAHVSFGPGFDEIMLEDMRENWILAPYLLPLDAENWRVRFDKLMAGYVFDSQLVMQHAENTQDLLQETMCLQGSCFLISAENYWKWNVCDESLGSWGSQAVELGIKAYLNGGSCYTTKKTYYGHLFRTDEIDFPYDRGKEPGKKSNEAIKARYLNQSIAPLIRKWNFPADWTEEKVQDLPVCVL